MKEQSKVPMPFSDSLRALRSEFDDIFDSWTRGLKLPSLDRTGAVGLMAPRVDVSETDTEIALTAELPGVDQKDLEVKLVGHELTIRGEKRSEFEDKSDKEGRVFHRVERSYGSFQRTFTVPYDIEPSAVSAQFDDGVLKVVLKKPTETQAKSRTIEIKKTAKPA